MAYAEYEEILSRLFSPWDHLSQAERDDIVRNCQYHLYTKGENLHRGEMDCVGMLLIITGELRVYMLSEEGREITLYRLYDGDSCILSASCVISTITFDVHIDADKDTRILIINAPAFARLTEANIYAECFAYKMATERFSEVMWAMQQILFMSLDRRLAIFLVDELANIGGERLNLTHEQIARYIGSAREVVSRMLKYFEDEGIVELSRGEIKIINKQKLRSLAED